MEISCSVNHRISNLLTQRNTICTKSLVPSSDKLLQGTIHFQEVTLRWSLPRTRLDIPMMHDMLSGSLKNNSFLSVPLHDILILFGNKCLANNIAFHDIQIWIERQPKHKCYRLDFLHVLICAYRLDFLHVLDGIHINLSNELTNEVYFVFRPMGYIPSSPCFRLCLLPLVSLSPKSLLHGSKFVFLGPTRSCRGHVH